MRDLLTKKLNRKEIVRYRQLPKFPSVLRDISFTVEQDIKAIQINEVFSEFLKNTLKGYKVFDYYPANGKKNFTYSLEFYNDEKTLSDDEVNKFQEKIVQNLSKKLGAELRK